MKLDKETLVKHQFWLLLGLSGVLTLAALVLLFFGSSAKAAKERKTFDEAKKNLGPTNALTRDPKNNSFLEPWEKRRKFFEGHKNTVWKQAWDTQSDIMTWPRELAYLEKGHFGDNIPDPERLSYKEKYYNTQFTADAFFAPEPGRGVYFPVTFNKDKIFGRLTWEQNKPAPTVEECWMAQEDIWVRREILKVLQKALRAMGHFNPIREPLWKQALPAAAGPGLDVLVHNDPQAKLSKDFTGVRLTRDAHGAPHVTGDAPKGTARSLLFCSHNWEVNLLLEPNPKATGVLRISAHSTIKNISPARRALSLSNAGKELRLRYRQDHGEGPLAQIEGELVRWGESSEFKKPFTPNLDFNKDFDLEEDFDPATSPIKVLEDLKVGREAIYNRFSAGGYVMQKGRLAPKPKEENPEGQPTSEPGGNPPGPQGGMPSQGSNRPQGGMPSQGGVPAGGVSPGPDGARPGMRGSAAEDVTPNGFNRFRYVLSPEIEPVRRIPVAFTIVVDQAYRNEVLAAVANSRLRIQTTWVYWAHRDHKAANGAGFVPGFVPSDRLRMMPPDGVRPPVGPVPPVGAGSGGGSDNRRPTSPPPPGGIGVPPGVGSGVPPGERIPPREGIPPGGGIPPSTEQAQPADAGAAANSNLIELTVHGVAALFERYPRKTKPAEGEKSADPAAPK